MRTSGRRLSTRSCKQHDVLGISATVRDARLLGNLLTATPRTALGGQFVIRLVTGHVTLLFTTFGGQHLVCFSALFEANDKNFRVDLLSSFCRGVVFRIVDDNDIRGTLGCSYRYPGARFSKVSKCFRTFNAIAKSRTL